MNLSHCLGSLGLSLCLGVAQATAYDVLTNHNDVARTGLVSSETVLTPANVPGLKIQFQNKVDGQVYAQPLAVTNQLVYTNGISQGKHNIVIVATEHDSVYAFDAETGTTYWQVSLLDPGDSPVQASDPKIHCGDLVPEIGITATPVIDRAAGPNGRIFVIAMETDGKGNYNYKLHALDLAKGSDAIIPATISASVKGSGPATTFVATEERARSALLLLNGTIYIAFAGFCDNPPFTGWLLGYSEHSLSPVAVFNDNPNGSPASTDLPDGSGGGIWQSGLGPSSDGNGHIYVATGNGPFDEQLSGGYPANQDYGDSALKLTTTSGLSVSDYFTPFNQQAEAASDQDLASGGVVVLPGIVDTKLRIHNLLVVCGKDANLYILNRSNLGKFNPLANKIYQEIPGATGGGTWSSVAYFNNSIYVVGVSNPLKRFQFDFSKPRKPLLDPTPAAQSSASFGSPSFTPSISSNGTKDGIVWGCEYTSSEDAVLHAFDATTLTELYNSGTLLGAATKFAVPTVFEGRVYLGTANSLVAFGL
jgi:outer membrane protein assembly factor BamB